MRIALAADHAGYALKDELVRWLGEQGHDVTDLGTNSADSVDYPEFGAKLARFVAAGNADPNEPVTGATFCVPPTAGAGKNTSIGLPGPARLVRQATATYFCASNPDVEYVPGAGGCP